MLYRAVCWESSTNITSPGICEIHFVIQQDEMKKELRTHPKAAASQWQEWKENPQDLIPGPSSPHQPVCFFVT